MRSVGAKLQTIAAMAFGGILGAWGLATAEPMAVAIGLPCFFAAASIWRFERVERQIAELREQRAEAR
jgi:hypothetical protein